MYLTYLLIYLINNNRYKKRCSEAVLDSLTSHPKIMSIIIDGMDQQHSECPYLGTQSSFGSNPLKQGIIGVKEHGHGVVLFRTFETVPKGASLTIYIILYMLDRFRKRNGYFPEKLYVQVDGGSENANRYVLGLLELLAIKRIVRVCFYSRLPTGHTHEDIDAVFAIIWDIFRYRPCETLQQYKELILTQLAQSKLNPSMVDVMVVPDFESWLEPCIDSKLSRMHKEIYTQHQWRFEAVTPDQHFPFGCKTMFRAYSSDKVVEIYKEVAGICTSEMGKTIGLEARTVFVKWYPSATDDDANTRPGIEGFYILHKIPHFDCENDVTGALNIFPPSSFPLDVHISISNVVKAVRKAYGTGNKEDLIVKNAWEEWNTVYAPSSDDALAYIMQHNCIPGLYCLPIQGYLYDKTKKVTQFNWDNSTVQPASVLDASFRWPEVIVATMNSVRSQFNPNPPAPRLISLDDTQLIAKLNIFTQQTASVYNTCSVAALQAILRRRLTHNCLAPSLSGKLLLLLLIAT